MELTATVAGAAVAWSNQVGAGRLGFSKAPVPDRAASRSLVTPPYRCAEVCYPARAAVTATFTIRLAGLRRRQAERFS